MVTIVAVEQEKMGNLLNLNISAEAVAMRMRRFQLTTFCIDARACTQRHVSSPACQRLCKIVTNPCLVMAEREDA